MAEIATDVKGLTSYVATNGFTVVDPVPSGIFVNGPCCGLISLMNALDVYHQRSHGTPSPLLIHKKNTTDSSAGTLYKAARNAEFTKIGELFYAASVVFLAAEFGLDRASARTVKVDELLPLIKKAVGEGRMVMVPYNCDDDGDPYIARKPAQADAHWALVFGYKADQVLSTHWGKFFKWDADTLARSNANIGPWKAETWKKMGIGEWEKSSMRRVNNKGYRKVSDVPRHESLAGYIVIL